MKNLELHLSMRLLLLSNKSCVCKNLIKNACQKRPTVELARRPHVGESCCCWLVA